MTRAEDLLQALNGLQRAADSELSGDAREAASEYIKELFRFAGFDGEDAGEGRGEEAVPFAQALAEVRTQAEGELSGNAFELASIIFDDLASLSPSPASAPQEHAREPVAEAAPHSSEPANETPVESARADAAQSAASFSEVGAASKARVEEVAASLGIGIARHSSPRLRSPAAPAVVGVIEAASAREVAEATHDFGIPAAEAGHVPEYAAPRAELRAPGSGGRIQAQTRGSCSAESDCDQGRATLCLDGAGGDACKTGQSDCAKAAAQRIGQDVLQLMV